MDMLTCQYIKLEQENTSLPTFFNLSSYVTGSLKVKIVLPPQRCYHIVIAIIGYWYITVVVIIIIIPAINNDDDNNNNNDKKKPR